MKCKYSMMKNVLFMSLLSGSAVNAQVIQEYQVQRPAITSVPVGLQSEQPRVEYIWPEIQSAASIAPVVQEVSSDYYWEVVTGEQLMTGVTIYSSSPDALLRVAPKADTSSGVKMVSRALDLSQMNLKGANNKALRLRQIASVETMRQAGFDDGSVAFALPKSQQPMLLKTSQSLAPQAQYLIQVKEKSSSFKLRVSAPNALTRSDNVLELDMSITGQMVPDSHVEAQLLSPSEPSKALVYKHGRVELPETLNQVGAFEGLYELQFTVMTTVDGHQVKRSAKMPFAQHVSTAELSGYIKRKGNKLLLPLEVNEPGRYSVRATLQGRDKSGRVISIQTAEVAQWFSGTEDLLLPFNLEEFDGLHGPFTLHNVQLQDQSRMIPLQNTLSVGYLDNRF